nr:MAG TPA: major capsid protein [Caudoviricetes sp.]
MSEIMTELQALRSTVQANQDTVKQIAENALKEARDNGALCVQAKAEADKAMAELNESRQKLNALEVRLGEAEQAFAALPAGGKSAQEKSLGGAVTAREDVQQFMAQMAAGGKGSISVPVKAALTSLDESAGKLVQPHRVGLIPTMTPRLTVRDLLAVGRTDSNSVEFMREKLFTNKADVVAEGTQKPESDLTFEAASAPIVTIAHWLHATRQILSDAPMLESYISTRLIQGLKLKEEAQLLNGSGVGLNIKGLYTAAQAYDNNGITVTGETPVDRVRLSLLQVELAELVADGVVLNPIDWADIELLKTTNSGEYLFASPFAQTVPRLWGLPVVATTSMEKGKFLTGAFRTAAQLWDRWDVSVTLSTEDGNNFTKNMVTVLCEERIGLTIFREQGLVKGALKA